MYAAAILSISSARRLRLASASSSARSAAAVERRSSQNATGRSGERRQIADEGAGRLRARSLRSVEIDGQADDQPARAMLFREAEKPLRVGLELRPADGFKRRRDLAHHVGKRKPDGLGANVQAKQALIALNRSKSSGSSRSSDGTTSSLSVVKFAGARLSYNASGAAGHS